MAAKKDTTVNNIKLGYFQLQTKSFWLSIVSLLCIFILVFCYVHIKFYDKMTDKIIQHEEEMIKMLLQISNKK